MEYIFSKRAKMTTYILMLIGLLALVTGIMHGAEDHYARVWSNLAVNGFFFFFIALGALFFISLQYVAEVAWYVTVKRIFEGIIKFIPIGAILVIVVLLAGSFHFHHIYHWMDTSLYPEFLEDGVTPNPDYDAIIAGKAAYLNQPFFWIRTLVYLATFYLGAQFFRKQSLIEDQLKGTETHFKSMGKAAVFIVLFAVFSSTLSWDWIMSIDTHWFSTLFGWYVFSGMWVTAMIVATMLVIYLKSKGLLEKVNENHIHDLGKWVFAISFLWSYLWFSQFMLIWYSNIPEEVTYFMQRIHDYRFLFYGVFFVNFVFPMVILMSRDAKRNVIFLVPVALIIFVGHWLDMFLMIMPATVGHHWHLGFVEWGMFAGFLGLFLNVVLGALAKRPLMVSSHPYLEESIHLHN